MTTQYEQAVTSLYQKLGLALPSLSTVTSLKVGEQVMHITEHPQGQLLMFSELGLVEHFDLVELLKINLFSQCVYKPVVGFDLDSNSVVIWSRQALSNTDASEYYQQLEQLSQMSDSAIDSIKNTTHTAIDSGFDASRFRV